jgi:hypothetical protein
MTPEKKSLNFVLENIKPVFVSGSPRSGTTVCHALLCTADNVNDYMPESSYFTGILNTFISGLNNSLHNVEFFGSEQEFIDHGLEQISSFLSYAWARFDKPEFLAFKDPLMFMHMNWLHKFFHNAKYVLTLRDPLEVISSRVVVERKMGRQVDNNFIANVSYELMIYNKFVKDLHAACGDRLTVIHYDQLLRDDAAKCFERIDPSIHIDQNKIWVTKYMKDVRKDSAWITDKIGKRVDEVHKTRLCLQDDQIEIVNNVCSNMYIEACAASSSKYAKPAPCRAAPAGDGAGRLPHVETEPRLRA